MVYTRDRRGNLTFPIDVSGSTGTILFGNNDSNWGVGRYTDALGVTHGLYFITPDNIHSFDYLGSTLTSLNGINKNGQVCGYYIDMAGIAMDSWHRWTPMPNAMLTRPAALRPTVTAHRLPKMLKMAEPAL